VTDTMTLTSPTAAAPTATTPTATSPAWSHLPHSGREDLFVEQRFAVVPEWMLDSTVSDTAFRLYAILARYGNTSGVRMPGRALLARRLHRSLDTVDRALKELTATGILSIERRSHDGRNLTNRYHLRTHDPDTPAGDTSPGSSRSPAAQPRCSYRTPPPPTTPAATPTPAPPAATPTTSRTEEEDLDTGTNRTSRTADGPHGGSAARDLTALAGTVQGLRRDLGQPSVRWSAPCLATAIDFATKVRGWPAQHARHALLLVAADPQTRSPMRLAEAGPGGTTPNNPA